MKRINPTIFIVYNDGDLVAIRMTGAVDRRRLWRITRKFLLSNWGKKVPKRFIQYGVTYEYSTPKQLHIDDFVLAAQEMVPHVN